MKIKKKIMYKFLSGKLIKIKICFNKTGTYAYTNIHIINICIYIHTYRER